MRHPVEETLHEQFDGDRFHDDSTTVVVPDCTRPLDYPAALDPLLDRLAECASRVSILVALGLHRPLNPDELASLRSLADRHGADLGQHDVTGPLTGLAADVAGNEPAWPTLPARFHPWICDADAVVCVGTVEPHQYAGFSGGAKAVSVGCASADTIDSMHGLEFLRLSGTRLGAVADNPFRSAIDRLAEPIDADLHGLQIVPPGAEQETSTVVEWGGLEPAFDRAVERARRRFFRPIDRPLDWLELDVPPSKASNVYQASRAATYAALVESPAVADGAQIVVRASCPEGVGRGDGERACARAMRRGRQTLVEELESGRDVETRGGEQRAYVIAQAMERCDLALVGAPKLPVLEEFGIRQFETFDRARRELGRDQAERALHVENPFHAIPILDTEVDHG
ncbi:MAG: lactate racemase domain-containing protein [Bradymonadaceae bacterium]